MRCEIEGIHKCNQNDHCVAWMDAQHLTNFRIHNRFAMVVGIHRDTQYPLFVGSGDDYILDLVAKYPKAIFFLAEGVDTDEDIRWFDGKPGPDWNCDIDTMKGL